MPTTGTFAYVYGPLTALIGVVILMLIARWAMRDGQSLVARPGSEQDYGMLVPIARPTTKSAGHDMCTRLADAGITANLASTKDGLRVLVWPADEERARALLGDADAPELGS